jgi:3-oxo-5-alpha-steroid 4-dehydrogenase 3
MASFDAAAAEFAGKALGTFWTLFFAASVAADLDLLPGVSARLRLFAARGKQADAEPSSPSAPADPRAASKWWVPHAWFAHFYVVGIACNAFVLAHALAVEPISAEHAAATLASCLFQAHVARRFLETAFVARHREGARMHLAGYLVGVFYYVAAPVTFATPETTRAVCETVRVALAKALAKAVRASGSASGGVEAPTRFFFASPRFAPPRFGAAVRSSLSLTARSVSSALAGAPVSVARVARVAAGAAAFALGSAKQARCHRLLARLRETPRATETTRRPPRAEDRSGTRLSSGTKLDTSNQSNTSSSQIRDVGRLYTNKTHYAVPRGDWFEMVSSPHYLAECVLYAGLALVAGARAFPRLAPMLAAVGANLALAARRTHAWYLETFPEYPKNRWAMVPGVL